jgi:oligopeptide/dipeptide ABC transporter ATP-binding protein
MSNPAAIQSPKSENLVTVNNLAKRFDTPGGFMKPPRSMMAVRGVSMTIPRGSVVGVVGESGCGKSTLARLVLRLLEPTSGSIHFDGTDLTTLAPRPMRALRRKMAMVFQDPYSSLDPRYTVGDVLEEPFKVQGQPATQARVEQLLAQVGMSPALATSFPHQMSGGQRQRIGIARALALNPDFIVLDEPTASLDVSIQAQIISLLEQLQADLGLTYLFISHDLGLVRYFCDRIVVMYLGAVVEELPNPKAAPRHPYTRALMDSNFSPDPLQRRELATLGGEIPSPFNLPKGCAFAARCTRASDRCRTENPSLHTDANGHRTACFHPLHS